MSSLASRVLVPALVLALGACSLAPRRLNIPARLAGHVTLSAATYARVPNALLTVSRCFRARALVPSCELVPLAEYRTDELGKFAMFIAIEGFYRFDVVACLNGEEHRAVQSLDVSTGQEVLAPFELQPYVGKQC